MKKNINKFILILLVLNIAIIYFIFARSYNKTQNIKIDGDKVVSEIEIEYDVQANPLSKITIDDLSNTDAKINSCVGSLGQSINISGNFFNFQLKDATVTMKYDENKLGDTPEESLGVLWYDKENQEMVTMESKIDPDKNTISFETNHFSEYILVNLDTWKEVWSERVVRVRNSSDTFNVSFVIDDSGSMASNDPQNLRIKATQNFIDILEDKDKFSIVKFEYSATVIQDTTSDKKTVEDLDSSFKSNGGTYIASGLEKGLELLDGEDSAGKVIVLLTDGEDNTLSSRKEEIINKALEKNVIIFTIFLNTGNNTNDGDTSDIADIATRTNGNFYTINTDEIIDIFKKVSQVSVGVDGTKDTDGDGLPDELELGGMRTIFGNTIYTNPYKADTDGDGINDGIEMGILDKKTGLCYAYVSDPTTKYGILVKEFTAGITNPSWSLGSWDSGFKLNRDAFQFRNLSVKANGGICEGIAILTEKTYNQEKVPESIEGNTEIYVTNKNSKDVIEKYTEGDSDVEIVEEKDEKGEKQLNVFYKSNGYDAMGGNLEIIFKKRLPYFYYPTTNELKKSKSISSNYLKQKNSDSDLLNCLFYYWIEGNEEAFKMYDEYSIDGVNSVTEDTISKLKVLFSNKKIVTIDLRAGYYHAINGYALEKKSESKYLLYVYDNNTPFKDEKNQYIELEKVQGTDRYKIKYNDGSGLRANIDSSDSNDDKFIAIKYKDKMINFTDEKLEL